jgi:hypothetical protein
LKPQIPWLRVFVEGVVIVGSILLAFGTDAGAQGKEEGAEGQESVSSLGRDFTSLRDGLDRSEARSLHLRTSYLETRAPRA